MRHLALLVIATALLAWPTVSFADTDSCNGAVADYNSTADDLQRAIEAYSQCVADSKGSDDCTSEFSTVQSDQSDFEDAVSNYASECGD